ncbi:hypothetical protein ADK65_22970 [Streptomyces sp. NRRL B-1140]|uniref:hypothetical protein n=1 Tax=Streptomyces sp. NRRL B-1140 TaxID=1415549 RepID=UPI0006AF8777|nr:hypothetical protein [Streptomyces sp. NRRL B-1140]KOV98520.1 hypothetical protein ADK65_22970 [Streptomyces sp. NRRL B-1140]
MIWWLRQRGGLGLLPAALVAFVLSVVLTSNVVLVFPAFLGDYAVPTELSNFLCLIPSVALVVCLERRLPAMERSAVRRLDARDITLVVGFALLVSAVAMAISPLGREAMWTAARNNLLFCGLALGAWPLLGHRATLLPVFWMIHSMFLGGRSLNDPYPWVIVTEEAHVAHAAAGAAAVFLAGVLSLICFAPRTDR